MGMQKSLLLRGKPENFMHPNKQKSKSVLIPTRAIQSVVDVAICVLSLAAAYLIRFEFSIPSVFVRQILLLAPIIALTRILANQLTGVYRIVWRYVGVREAFVFARATVIVSCVLLALRLLAPTNLAVLKVPLSVIILEGLFVFLGLAASRLLRRILHESSKRGPGASAENLTLLIGAGRNGLAIAKESLQHRESLEIRVVGFLDDDLTKARMALHGLRVLGTLDDIEAVVKRTATTQVIITSSAVPSEAIVGLIEKCRPLDIRVRTVPGLLEQIGTSLNAQSLREVRIEDLLSRDPVPPSLSMDDLRKLYSGKKIMVTGAGGSIGSELCRQLVALQPSKLLLLERDENNLFFVHREVQNSPIQVPCSPILADICDRKNLERIFREHKPEVIFHAAAFKHVPMMERFPTGSASNNVFGTKVLGELADEHNVESFVMISTDKAVNPKSVMGATKRLAEIVIQRLAKKSATRFSCVRFGNVLGSRGSVIPLFREQIKMGGPVTVTHPEATRYFMTIPEASNLVIQAGTLGESGEIYLLDMGEPTKIMDLARQMIYLSGVSEDQVPIKIVGSRPGEKLFEELKTDREGMTNTKLRKISKIAPEVFEDMQVDAILQRLDFAIRAGDHLGVRAALEDLGIGFTKKPRSMSTGSQPVV